MSLSKFIAITTILVASSVFLFNEVFAASTKNAWLLLCQKDNQNCKAYAHIKTDNNVIASTLTLQKITFKKGQAPKTVAIIMLPLGLHIPSGIKVSIDKKISFNANLIECKTKGCRAAFDANEKILTHLKNGEKFYIRLVDSTSRKSLQLTYSLKGFSKTYASLSELN